MSLSDYKDFYHTNGYLVIENFFDADTIKQADQVIQDILRSHNPTDIAELEPQDGSTVRRIWAPTQRHSFFQEMAESEKLLDMVELLIGKNIVLQYSKLNMKGPKVGSLVDWHQDFSYYPHTNTDLLSALIYLDDATRKNGCLEVIPGSHQLGLVDHCVSGHFRGKLSPENIAPYQQKAIALEAPRGTVIFLHCLTLHFSAVNTSLKSRRAFLPAYRAADAFPIYFGPHASHNEPNAKLVRGEKSDVARCEAGSWRLPLAEAEFNSLYEIQEGAHTEKYNKNKKTGYFSHV